MVQGELLTTIDAIEINANETRQSTTHAYHKPGQEKGAHHV